MAAGSLFFILIFIFILHLFPAEKEAFLKLTHFTGGCQFQLSFWTGKCLNDPFLFSCFVLTRGECSISIT